MEIVDVEFDFYLRLGTRNPYWTLTVDSNVLSFGASPSAAGVASELANTEADRIRSLGDTIEMLCCSVRLAGRQHTLHLVGRRVSAHKWRGIASAESNFLPSESMLSALVEQAPNNVVSLRGSKRIG